MTVSLATEPWQSWNTQNGVTLKAWRVGARDPKTGVIRTLAIINRELPGDEQVAAATLMAAVPELVKLLGEAACFLEDMNDDPAYKPGRVKSLLKEINAILIKTEA